MTVPIANALVTATPTSLGYPILSGYTNAQGQIVFPMVSTITYNLKFSGPALGAFAGFTPQSFTFTFWKITNKGTTSISISNQKLKPASNVALFGGPLTPVKATTPSTGSWNPGTYFRQPTKSQTSFYAPTTDLSISWKTVAPLSVYAIDGTSSAKRNNNNAYNPGTNVWTAKAPDTTARGSLAAGVIGSHAYVVGGYNGTSHLLFNHAYDPKTNTWSNKASVLTKGIPVVAGVVASILYGMDGYNGTSYLGANDAYNPSTNTWVAKASDPTPRLDVAAGVVTSRIYVVGGENGTGTYLAINHAYDPGTNTWSTKASDLKTVAAPTAGVVASHVYVIDGTSNAAGSPHDAYNPKTNTWSARALNPTGRFALAAGVISSRIYAVDGDGLPKGNHAYDPGTNTWSIKASDLTGRFYLAAVVL